MCGFVPTENDTSDQATVLTILLIVIAIMFLLLLVVFLIILYVYLKERWCEIFWSLKFCRSWRLEHSKVVVLKQKHIMLLPGQIPFAALTIGKEIGRYENLKHSVFTNLSIRGYYGTVYKAVYDKTPVAVKIMNEDLVSAGKGQEFVKEAQLMMKLPKQRNLVAFRYRKCCAFLNFN